ncbi:TIGR03751 family conjugal transfer lipoprotein [Parahaliea mediterranea]|uniref:TIGR03751 family conjugal transfer lipoprotein n=1 Tax=Parahaliea mediterranea TaxID=651086 RepID=UPI000C0A1B46|nr:TIGR03751 family conjugal transfer lipoprotein [Parahaliea mediterranea]MAC35363.1 TIGR03751 family conjugal transfer lipoprotein [Haliea sp.]|tara:strand:- start:31 stop:480 length:450 start_codon:yes stop_codon:yes gene_type:complete
MFRSSINTLGIKGTAFILSALLLTGCATTKDELLTHDGQTMHDIWSREAGSGTGGGRVARELLDARQSLRRPLTSEEIDGAAADQARYSRTAQNEIYSQFKRLPNPDLVMYVFPHLAGTDPVPVPGYSTVFPLYQRVQYALPGERVEDY